jgi:hypothetical protein
MPKHMSTKQLKAYRDHPWDDQSSDPKDNFISSVPNAELPFCYSKASRREVRREISELKSQSAPKAMILLKTKTGCDLAQSKASVLHIRTADSSCHYCSAVVARGALLCSQCMSVNLDWML